MPWAMDIYDQLNESQKKVLKEVHERKYHISMDKILAEIQVRTEFLRRDFTKRQMNIITFIYNYSFGFGKEWALIPKMKDFEIAGISKIIARKEIEKLVEMGVVEWNQEDNLFRIKDPREWETAYNNGFSHDRSRELRRINVIHSGIDVKE